MKLTLTLGSEEDIALAHALDKNGGFILDITTAGVRSFRGLELAIVNYEDHENQKSFWEAHTPEAELWLMLNAPTPS